jgi:putative glutamine amidotransferase
MVSDSRPRIAIPMPHSGDQEYAERSIPQYERAVELAGGDPVRIPLGQSSDTVQKIINDCDGVLLPGSSADIDPARFAAPRSSHTAAADVPRETIDNLLLHDAYAHRKPILGICFGLQSLNVYRCGSLIQHVPDFLPEELRTRVNHEAGKTVPVAHSVDVERDSKLAAILQNNGSTGSTTNKKIVVPVNSSHHQSAGIIGDDLRISARCLEDGIIEAVEGTAPDHFVVAVQWHPERSVDFDEPSRAIFSALVEAAARRR